MEKVFTDLPKETKMEMLQYIPSFRRLNKQYYTEGDKIFYDRYCNLSISLKEFVN